MIERNPQLLPHEDEDVSDELRAMLEAEGIFFRTNATCIALNRDGASVSVALECQDEPAKVFGSHILLAIGRVPNTDDLGWSLQGSK